MNLSKTLLISTLVLSLAGCSLFNSEEDIIEVAPSPEITAPSPVKQVWRNSTSGNKTIYSLLSPAYYDNTVYAASRSGQLKAIDMITGNTIWSVDLSNSTFFRSQTALLSGGVTADAQHVYVASERAVVYAIDRATGAIVWQKQVAGEVLAKPIPTDDKLIVHTANGYIQTLNRLTGDIIWDIKSETPTLTLRGNSTPTVAYGALLIGDDSGRVSAYYLADGQLIWQQRISQPTGSNEIAKLNDIDATPIVESGLVYAVGYNGNVVALDLSNGQTVWRKQLGSVHNLALNNKYLFAIDQDDNLIAVEKISGTILWKQTDLLHRQLTDPVIYQNSLIVGDFEGFLYWINLEDGHITAKTNLNDSGIQAKPLVIEDLIIVQTKNGDIYALTKN